MPEKTFAPDTFAAKTFAGEIFHGSGGAPTRRRTFGSAAWAAWTFRAGHWRGVGVTPPVPTVPPEAGTGHAAAPRRRRLSREQAELIYEDALILWEPLVGLEMAEALALEEVRL